MKNFLQVFLISTALLFILTIESYPQVLEWSVSNGGYGASISVSSIGDSYITGSFRGSAAFGNIILTDSDYGTGANAFIAKYNTAGNCIWAKPIVGLNFIQGNGISQDSNGYVYITGRFADSISFGNIQYITTGNGSFFIAKYDSSGNCIWAKIDSTSFNSFVYGNGIALDAGGNSYICGIFAGTVRFGNFPLTTSGNSNLFITKYDSTGNCIWAKKDSCNYSSSAYGISTNASGNIYITGKFNGTDIFGNYTLTSSNPDADAFIAKYDSSGNCIWAKQTSSTGAASGQGITVDSFGNSYSTGSFSGNVSFGNIHLTASGSADAYTAKYDINGNCIWVQHDSGSSGGTGIAIDAKSNVYTTGPSIVKFDSSGNYIWSKQISGGQGIGTDAHGNSYVVGDEFVAKISGSYTYINNTKITPAKFELSQNYPNPFNPTTTIEYSVPKTSIVTIKVYDILGKEIATLLNEMNNAGMHEVKWNAGKYASGVYIFRISAASIKTNEQFIKAIKMVLIK